MSEELQAQRNNALAVLGEAYLIIEEQQIRVQQAKQVLQSINGQANAPEDPAPEVEEVKKKKKT